MPLPVELLSFEGTKIDGVNHLIWTTLSEINNDFFIVERSKDGVNFEEISVINGQGNVNTPTFYEITDENHDDCINYYRLTQTDFNGVLTTFNVVAIDNTKKKLKGFKMAINVLGQQVDTTTKGIVILIYENGRPTNYKKLSIN
jgi:hypothetical protein